MIHFVLAVAFVLVDPFPSPSPTPVPPSARMIVTEHSKTIYFDASGTVRFSPGVQLTEAAKAFWSTVEQLNPLRAEVERLRLENAALKRCQERAR